MVEFSKVSMAAMAVRQGKMTAAEAAKKFGVNLSELQKECKNLPNILANNSEPVADNPTETLNVNNKLKEAFDTVCEKLFPKGDVFTTKQKLNKADFEKINKEISNPYEKAKDKSLRGEYTDKYKGAWVGGDTATILTGSKEGTKITLNSTVEKASNGVKPIFVTGDEQLDGELTVWTVERTVENPDGTKTRTITANYFDTETGELKATVHDNGAGKVDYINYETGNIQTSQGV